MRSELHLRSGPYINYPDFGDFKRPIQADYSAETGKPPDLSTLSFLTFFDGSATKISADDWTYPWCYYLCLMTDISHLSLEELSLNEASRPMAPAVPEATDQHRRQGQQLAAIHRHYLMEMAQIGAVLARIEARDAPPEHLKRIVLSLDMAENLRGFGSLCGRECQVLKFHHDIESADMFPRIEAAGEGKFREVVAKLIAEHEVVHELIIRLERAADVLTDDPSEANLADAAATFRKLEEIVRAHFSYEETELAEAIGYYLGAI